MKEQFSDALQGKKIPVLTLDNKWYRLMDEQTRKGLASTETKLNDLIKRQGKLNTEVKEIKNLKKKLMNEIVTMADENNQDAGNERLIEKNKKLLEDCNRKLDDYQDELLELPREIDNLNRELMLATMEHCYREMQENETEIDDIAKWVVQVRIELKKRLIRKQEMEQKNHNIYSYMHDIFGADVVNLFDMKYNPEKNSSGSLE